MLKLALGKPMIEEKEISVALKIEGEDEFIGFNNWSYLWPQWRNPDWVIRKV